MIRAVLDTNVIVGGIAGYHGPRRTAGQIIRFALGGRFTLLLSDAIVEEAARVLATKRYFQLMVPRDGASELMSALQAVAQPVVDVVTIPGVAPHWHDDAILAAVAASHADWFVTGDRELLAMRHHAGVPFINPSGFLAVLNAAG